MDLERTPPSNTHRTETLASCPRKDRGRILTLGKEECPGWTTEALEDLSTGSEEILYPEDPYYEGRLAGFFEGRTSRDREVSLLRDELERLWTVLWNPPVEIASATIRRIDANSVRQKMRGAA